MAKRTGLNPIIELTPWEYEHGFAVGIARFVENWGRPDARHYQGNRRLMEPDRAANPAAALCEIAVARYTNQHWHGHVWKVKDHAKHRDTADVGTNIEVRRTRGKEVAVRRSDAGKVVWAARTIDDEYRKIELLGFIPADEVIPLIGDGGFGYVRYPLEKLTKPWLEEDA
jgi:hypothetical protein